MSKSWLSYMLVTLIALQSVLAMADAHQIFQSDSQHYNKVLDGGNFDIASMSNTGSDDTTIAYGLDPIDTAEATDTAEAGVTAYDCSHCCHCHGGSPFFFPATDSSLLSIAGPAYHVPGRQTRYRSLRASPDLRPPII